MKPTTDPRIMPAERLIREERIAYWRNLARENLLLGFMDLARRCEGYASSWEFDGEPT